MGSWLAEKWPWVLVALLYLYISGFGPLQISNILKGRPSPEQVIETALGPDVRLEEQVSIRPSHLEPGRRGMAFGRIVVCGVAVSGDDRLPLAVIYPLRRSSTGPFVVTAANPGGGDNFVIGPAMLRRCREARAKAFRDWRQPVVNALVETIG